MPKKSSRVVLTLLGSAALGVGCSQAPPVPPPADSFEAQVDLEKEPGEEQSAGVAGQTAATQTPGTSHSSHHYHRGSSLWPLIFWGTMSRPSAPMYHPGPQSRPGTASSVPRGPSHVMPPPIPSHSSHVTPPPITSHASTHSPSPHVTPSHSPTTHSTTTHSSSSHTGSTSHTSSHGFGSTGHSFSGGS